MSETYSADVVIVGSGVGGALVADKLAQAGVSVLLLEAGPAVPRWQIVENFRNSPSKQDYMSPYPPTEYAPFPQYSPPNDYLILKGRDASAYAQQYIRYVGGTTWHWAACAWRQMPVDFKLYSTYGVGRDYPLTYEEIEPYYNMAEAELGVSGPQDIPQQSPPQRSKPYPMNALPFGQNDTIFARYATEAGYRVVPEPVARNSSPYDGRPQCCGNNNCMPICPIGAMYSAQIHVYRAQRAGAKLVPQAVVYRIETDAKKQVQAVHFYDADKVSHRVAGKYFVLAANGIETPRLLLLSKDDNNPNGVANSSDQVGRNMMDHPGLSVNFLAKDEVWAGRGPIEMSAIVNFRDGAFRREYAASKLQLNNASQAMKAGKKALELGLTGKKLDDEIRYRAAHGVQVNSFHDILANPENRLVLSDDYKDPMGLARPQITYDVGDYVRRSGVQTQAVFRELARRMGGVEVDLTQTYAPNNHIMGGTIMGADPKNSVSDKNCRSYDNPNLFFFDKRGHAGRRHGQLHFDHRGFRIADRRSIERRFTPGLKQRPFLFNRKLL